MKQIVSRPLKLFSPTGIARLVLYGFVRLVYRIRSGGTDHLPPTGGALLISNHISYVDAFLLQVASPRYLHFVASEHFLKKWWLGWAMRAMEVVPISPTRPKRALQTVVRRLKEGEVVCIFPEGTLSRTGNLQGFQKGFEVMARQAGVPVVPAVIDGIWGSVFSHSARRLFEKRPLPFRCQIQVTFGAPLRGNDIERGRAWQTTLDLHNQSFSKREEFTGHLARSAIKALCRAPWKKQTVESGPEKQSLSRGELLALAITLARKWKTTMPEKRIGVRLPPGRAAPVANLAVILLDKTAVNLDFKMSGESIQSCCRQAELETILGTESVRKRCEDIPSRKKTIDVFREIECCDKKEILLWHVAAWVLPSRLLIRLLGIPKRGGNQEAAVLFPAANPEETRGVILSHRNILAAARQISETALLHPADILAGDLDVSHSFAFTTTLWYPLLRGIPTVTTPFPADTHPAPRPFKNRHPSILIGMPPFPPACLKHASAETRESVRLIIVAAAEKLRAGLRESLQETFHAPVMKAYGLAETTGVASFCIPDPEGITAGGRKPLGTRPGSVGRLLPGMSARLFDLQSGEETPSLLGEGLLALGGPNIFHGYLKNNETTRKSLKDGLFITGDIARFDEDGFLFIEGRLPKASKTGNSTGKINYSRSLSFPQDQ